MDYTEAKNILSLREALRFNDNTIFDFDNI